MKLILANNQSDKFVAFYQELQQQATEPFDYTDYSSLLFVFDSAANKPLRVINQATGRDLTAYDGVYINGYLRTYELAASVAIACDALKVPYVNQELHEPPSLSKLTMHAKLAAHGVRTPTSLAGSKLAILKAQEQIAQLSFPAVLKRADADRGIDNYKVSAAAEIEKLLRDQDDRSLWILQEYVENDGFYLVSFYGQAPKFCIFRSLEARPDGNQQKAHMYKPKGGANASLIDLDEAPQPVLQACQQAVVAMNRQIASVDCLYDPKTQQAYILEVNYNPQLVTIETFKDVRMQAFLDYLPEIGK